MFPTEGILAFFLGRQPTHGKSQHRPGTDPTRSSQPLQPGHRGGVEAWRKPKKVRSHGFNTQMLHGAGIFTYMTRSFLG